MFNNFLNFLGTITFMIIIFTIIFGEFEIKINKNYYKINGILKKFFEDKEDRNR